MVDTKTLDDLMQRLTRGLPPGLDLVRDDLRANLNAVLNSALARMDLVSRDEFDVQCAVLARTRAKVDALERKVAELEEALKARAGPGGARR